MTRILLFSLAASLILAACQSNKQAPAQAVEAEKPAAPEAKYCALTFDDGPDVVKTPLVLEKLEKYGVPATFFYIGQLVNDRTKPVMDRAIGDGCEIGNHSWGWSSLNVMSKEKILDSVSKTSGAIEKYTGRRPKFFRPPNLAVGPNMIKAIDMPFVSGVLGYDWAGCDTTAEDRAHNVLKEMEDGAIILLHDVQPDPHPTPEALDIIIPELKKQGYVFLTLSRLFDEKGVTPQLHDGKLWVFVK
jgi:peptidoglycan/xylan/chitin deacetylase (PgdA/CDA1 family)